jgi:hypothetical protein
MHLSRGSERGVNLISAAFFHDPNSSEESECIEPTVNAHHLRECVALKPSIEPLPVFLFGCSAIAIFEKAPASSRAWS